MTAEELPDGSILHTPGLGDSIASRSFPDGTFIGVEAMIFTNRLCIAYAGTIFGCWDDVWCFDKNINIVEIMTNWNPYEQKEPMGWNRHPPTGRRRIDGDPSQEYVRA